MRGWGGGWGGFFLPKIFPFASQGFFFTSDVHSDLSPLPWLELGSHKRRCQNDPKRERGGQDPSVSGDCGPNALGRQAAAPAFRALPGSGSGKLLEGERREQEERTGEAGTWRAQETGGEGERAAGPPP